ncbi:MAG: Gfo/Idh/MocA family protein [Anaerolineae bacterium]
MTRKLRVALIGCGGIASAHATAYCACPDLCELVAGSDVSLAAANKLAEEFGFRAYTDTLRMLEEVAPDAVSICTPPVWHLPMARLAAQRGIAILCEKPLARNLPEADEIVALVRETGVLFMNALCHRFHGPINQLRSLITDGVVGQPVHWHNRFAFRFEGVQDRWFTNPEIAGGGVLLDTAVHSLDIFRYVVGEVRSIRAEVSTHLPIPVEDSAMLLVTSETGVTGEISCSWVTPPGESTITLYGTEATARLDYEADPNLSYQVAGRPWTPVPYTGPDRFEGEIRHFCECVRDGISPRITVEDGARAIALIDEAYRTARHV